MTGRVVVAFACAGTPLFAVASSSARAFDGASARAEYSVGYMTPRATS